MHGLVWFREDLRIEDNTALYQAQQACEQVVGIYIIVPTMWHQHQVAPCRVEFILRGLKALSADLALLNIPLLIVFADDLSDVSTLILKQMNQLNIKTLFCNRQYEVNEQKRDQQVLQCLQANQREMQSYDDTCILAPGSVCKASGEYYQVFTAYKRTWQAVFLEAAIKRLPRLKKQKPMDLTATQVPDHVEGFQSTIDPKQWPAGERAAQKKLQYFINHSLKTYDQTRDYPAAEGTSRLSPYLTAGMISPRVCFLEAYDYNHRELDSGNPGATTWMNELIWRDFYKHILWYVPRVSMGRAYQLETEKIDWQYNEKHLIAWQEGQTGFPIIDAAMRQLNTTGWMHNRLRMIVAMFFSKNLLLDWRLGEQYFMAHLIDGDLAANNGGWQWSASTGTDAVPYFRIFNPTTQSERFDAKGAFIRHYCPELSEFDDKAIHDPYHRAPLLAKACGYPEPIVDIRATRERAIMAFKKIKTTLL